MRRAAFVVLAVLLLLLAGCQTVTFKGLQVVTKVPAYTELKSFTIVVKDPHLLGGLVPMGQPDETIFALIQEEITKLGGNAAINVEIDYGFTTVDFILNLVTWNIYSPRTITITGTAVKYR